MAFNYAQWVHTTSEYVANFKLVGLLHRQHVRSDAPCMWS